MKLSQVLLASLLSATALKTFAATEEQATQPQTDKVVVSTQEQPATTDTTTTAADASAPASEASAETAPAAQ